MMMEIAKEGQFIRVTDNTNNEEFYEIDTLGHVAHVTQGSIVAKLSDGEYYYIKHGCYKIV